MSIAGPQALVWSNVNAVSSDFAAAQVFLEGLAPDEQELRGEWVEVDGRVLLQGRFRQKPFLGKRTEALHTNDRFDMVTLYHSLDRLFRGMDRLGYDVRRIMSGGMGGTFHPLVAHAHGTDMVNAWFDRQTGELTFGLGIVEGAERWHLAADGDVAVHEAGHAVLHAFRPGLGGPGGREGGPFHEGFGDALAAFLNQDPELSEDYIFVLTGERNPRKGMRTADNDLALTDVSNEVHDRGRLFAGFYWSLLGRLAKGGELPFDVGLRLLLNTGGNFQTNRPHTGSIVEAVLLGANALAAAEAVPYTESELREAITAEARRRLFIGHFDEVGSPTFNMSEQELVRLLGGSERVLLTPAHEAPFIGGTQLVLQQHFLSPGYGVIPLIGAQIAVNRWDYESGALLTLRDARPIADGEIDETVRITFREAVEQVYDKVLVELEAAKREWARLLVEIAGRPSNRRELKRFTEAQKRIVFLEEVLRLIQKEFENGRIEKKFCILPGKNRLHYKLEIGPFIFYVDSQVGKISSFRQRFT